jgi:ATP/maltotriose-dependent transcriptional regulator MalT
MKKHSILTSKLTPPDRSQMIMRQRLLEIAENSEERLVIICADAGYGKTTIMEQLRSAYSGHSVWYQLGPEDRDLSVFLTHLAEGVSRAVPDFGKKTDRALMNTENVAADHENIMMVLVSEILEFAKEPLALCFDEFRHINDSNPTQEAIQFLVNHLPSSFRIMITSREKPNLLLGRLRSQRQLFEFDTDDLRFDLEEAATLFEGSCSPPLAERELKAWTKATDGWPVALTLSRNLLRSNRRLPEEILKDLVDNRGSIATYLAEEIWTGLSEKLKDFMMRSSLPDIIDVDICDKTLTEHKEINYSMKFLQEMEDRNLMIFSLETGKRYRYQPQVRQYLRRKLSEKMSPVDIAELNIRYGEAYEQRGDYDNAIKHYQDSGSMHLVAGIIEDQGEAFMAAGRYESLARWISVIPESAIKSKPLLAYVCAKTSEHLGEMEKAESMYVMAETGFNKKGDKHGTFICVYALAEYYFMKEMYRKSLEMATRALPLADEPLDRITVLTRMMRSSLIIGDTTRAFQILRQADEAIDDTMVEARLVLSTENMAVNWMTGDFKGSMETVLGLEKEATPQTSMQTRFIVLFFKMSNLREAAQYLEALATAEEAADYLGSEDKIQKLIFQLQKAVTLLCVGDGTAGREMMERIIAKIGGSAPLGPYFSFNYLGDYYRRYGMPDKAIELLIPELRSNREKDIRYSIASSLVNLGANKLRRVNGPGNTGLANLEEASQIAKENNYRFTLTQVHFQQAWRALGLRDEAKALDEITKSLDIAAHFQHNNFILQEGKISLDLLAFAFEADVHRDYLTKIFGLIGPPALSVLSPLIKSSSASLRMAVIPALGKAGGAQAAPYVRRLIRDTDATVRRAASAELASLRTNIEEPGKILTKRENQVFEMLTQGHSNAEIAQQLFISEPTVKTHVTRIFQKLGLTRRSQAAVYFHRDRHPAGGAAN